MWNFKGHTQITFCNTSTTILTLLPKSSVLTPLSSSSILFHRNIAKWCFKLFPHLCHQFIWIKFSWVRVKYHTIYHLMICLSSNQACTNFEDDVAASQCHNQSKGWECINHGLATSRHVTLFTDRPHQIRGKSFITYYFWNMASYSSLPRDLNIPPNPNLWEKFQLPPLSQKLVWTSAAN